MPLHPTARGSLETASSPSSLQPTPHLTLLGWCCWKLPMPHVAPTALRAPHERGETARGGGTKPPSPPHLVFAQVQEGGPLLTKDLCQGFADRCRTTNARMTCGHERTGKSSALNPKIHGTNQWLPRVYKKREMVISGKIPYHYPRFFTLKLYMCSPRTLKPYTQL